MFEKLQKYCENELSTIDKYGADAENACNRAYGAMMFACYIASNNEGEEIGKWWNDVMRDKFYDRMYPHFKKKGVT